MLIRIPKRGFIANLASLSSAHYLSVFVSLGTLMYSAKVLGPEGRGAYATCISWSSILAICFSCSAGRVAMKVASDEQDESSWLGEALSAGVTFVFFGSLIAILTATLLRWVKPGLFGEMQFDVFIGLLVLIPIFMWNQFKNPVLLASNQVRIRSIAQFSGAVTAFLSAVFFLNVLGPEPIGLVLAFICGESVSSFLGTSQIWRLAGGKGWAYSYKRLGFWFKGGLKLHANAAANLIRAQTDIVMLGGFLSREAVGLYQLSSRLVEIMGVLPNAASGAMMAQLAGRNINELWFHQKKIMLRMMLLVLVLSALAYHLVPIFIPILFGEKFRLSGEIFRWLLPVLIGKSIGGMMTSQILGRGYFLQASAIGVAAAGANILLNYLLIPTFGMMGAVYATLVSYAIITIIINLAYGIYIDKKARTALG